MKKLLSLFAAVLVTGSMIAGTATDTMRVYCKMEQGWWKADGAAVGIHYWGGEGATNWPGVRMTPVEGVADTWYYDLDTTQCRNVIFTRVNGSGDVSDWGAKTKDLVVPADGKNLFTITNSEAAWGDPGCDGAWSVYGVEPGPGPEPEVTQDTLYLVNSKGWGAPKIYFYGGTVGQLTAWPGDAMTKVEGVKADGFDVYMFAVNHGDHANVIFNNGGSVQSGDLVIAGNEGKYFNFADQTWYDSAEAVVCTWYLNANFNGATEWRELTRGEGNFTRRDVYAPAANYYYNGMAAENLKSEIKGNKLTVDAALAAGDSAVFTLDPYTKTINIVKIEVYTPEITKDSTMFIAGNFTDWAEGMQALPYTIALPADSALEFKQVMQVITYADGVATDTTLTWYGQTGEEGVMTRESSCWLLDGDYNVRLITDAEGDYTFALNENGEMMVTFPEKTPTAMDNIESEKVVKIIRNGQVIILRNGQAFNVVGTQE